MRRYGQTALLIGLMASSQLATAQESSGPVDVSAPFGIAIIGLLFVLSKARKK